LAMNNEFFNIFKSGNDSQPSVNNNIWDMLDPNIFSFQTETPSESPMTSPTTSPYISHNQRNDNKKKILVGKNDSEDKENNLFGGKNDFWNKKEVKDNSVDSQKPPAMPVDWGFMTPIGLDNGVSNGIEKEVNGSFKVSDRIDNSFNVSNGMFDMMNGKVNEGFNVEKEVEKRESNGEEDFFAISRE